ncbi:MAG: glycosyltransferase family 2 protein [Rickettsiales bacterium]|jgi:hypothetical protein|nr:glycosyltransferase family 2 protein [Rickettsiales bacterium]
MKKIAVITMARNDEWFLNRWIAYYGRHFGEENLFIYLDGLDQKAPSGAGRAHIKAVDKLGIEVVDAERQRLDFLSDRAAGLFAMGYGIVIGTDADEFLALDPRAGDNLARYLSDKKFGAVLSPLGLDFAEHPSEKPFDESKLFLRQREHALIHSRFTKASIISRPARWGRGFHRARGHGFRIDPNLYLLHFGNYSLDAVRAKMKHPDIIARNEVRHYERNRLRIFGEVARGKNYRGDFDSSVRMARVVQTFARSPFAWNKPKMLGLKRAVKIPERFGNIV